MFSLSIWLSLNRFKFLKLFRAIKSANVILAMYCREQVLFTGNNQRAVVYHSYFGVQNPMRCQVYQDLRQWLSEISFPRGVRYRSISWHSVCVWILMPGQSASRCCSTRFSRRMVSPTNSLTSCNDSSRKNPQ